jgi:hypothetical protein
MKKLMVGALCLLALGQPAAAAKVIYKISGAGSGALTIGSVSGSTQTPFGPSSFIITLDGETVDTTVQERFTFITNGTIDIDGVGSFEFAEGLELGHTGNSFYLLQSGVDLLNFTLSTADTGAFQFQSGYLARLSQSVDSSQFGAALVNGTLSLNIPRDLGGQANPVQFETLAVPEPETWALLISGFALTGAALRRNRARGTLLAA